MVPEADESAVSQRCFIVGCPRSGTTLLQGMLAAHPRIMSFPETHFFMFAYPKNPLRRALGWPALRVQGVLENLLKKLNRRDLVGEAHIGLFDRNFHQSFVRVLDRLTLDAGKDIWVEKTPIHLHYIEQIQTRIPKVKFIHIIRNGADVVASLYKATNEHPRKWALGSRRFRGYSTEQCIARWNYDILITARWVKEPNHLVVRYEKLVDDPPSVLRGVSRFLGVEYTDEMEKPERVFHSIVSPTEKWKASNARGILGRQSKFDRVFNQCEKNYVLNNLVQVDFD